MGINEFEKGRKFCFNQSIDYADKAVVSKQILKKKAGNISVLAFEKGEALPELTTPYDATIFIVEGKAEIIIDRNLNSLDAGESIIIPRNVPYILKALERLKILRIIINSM